MCVSEDRQQPCDIWTSAGLFRADSPPPTGARNRSSPDGNQRLVPKNNNGPQNSHQECALT